MLHLNLNSMNNSSVEIDRISTLLIVCLDTIFDDFVAQSSKENEEISTSAEVSGRRKKLSDVLFLSDVADDAFQVSLQSEREDSDDDEMELDIVTSASGDDSHDPESRNFRRSLNLIFHGETESCRDNCHLDSSNGSPSASSQKDTNYEVCFSYWRFERTDRN